MGSILVENLPALIERIKTDYNQWIDESNATHSGWTGLSGEVQQFFKSNKTPYEKYKELFYSPESHTIAVSYVWKQTSLLDISAELSKPEYRKGRVFIDVLLVPQQEVESEQVVGTTSNAYSDCWVVAFVKGGYLRRAWCCCELAVATKHHCKITVIGTCDQVVGRDFFGKMEATVETDIKLIKAEIIKEHGTAKAFNDVVASAMEVLFVSAAKNKDCKLFEGVGHRHERNKWRTRLLSTNPQEQQRDKHTDWEVLIGNISHASASINRTLNVCLVSTLTDTILEWSFFLQDCVPYLEKCAFKRGLDLVISDMRRGCRDEDSVTPEVTLAELLRCKAESASVCFLVICGDKYGYRPIPTRIAKAHFDDLIKTMSSDDADRVRGCYVLDKNQLNQEMLPASEYVLQKANISSQIVERDAMLSSIFRAAAKQLWPEEELRNPMSKHPIKSFFISKEEMALFQGIFCDPVKGQDVHVYLRSFQPDSLHFDTSPVIGIYTNKLDDQGAVQLHRDLKNTMLPGVLEPECITTYKIAFQEGINPDSVDEHIAYLSKFLDHSCDVVLQSLDKLEQRLAVKPSPLVDEIRLHLDFAQVRSQRFCDTPSSSAALERVRRYLSGKGERTLVLWAPSGAGKTYVLAKAATEGETGGAPRSTVVMRFLGTSSKSSDVLSLLQSVCGQLQTISVGKQSSTEGQHGQRSGLEPCPTSYEDLCKYFKTALESWSWGPLSIFLDSVDQLDDTNSGRKLAWLPLEGYSDQVHMVVSTLPDEINPDVGRPFRCLSTLKKGLKEGNFVQVEALQDAQSLLRHLLRLKGRCTTADQTRLIVDTLGRAENKAQTPLMATLLAHLASGWNSFTNTPTSLPSSVRGIIFEFFQILERKQGETLVKHVLCLITLAKQGLSVSELQELLSLDDDALAASFEWWVTPQLKMPSAPVLLLITDLAPFLSKRGVVIFWYHRQLWEAVEAIYLKEPELRAAFHRILAEFFCGRWSGDKKKPYNENLRIRLGTDNSSSEIAVERAGCRHVRDQPYHLKGSSALHPEAEYNTRRSVEALYQMVKELEFRSQGRESGRMRWSDGLNTCLEMAAEELCSVDGVCARSMVGEEFNLVSQCAKVAELSSLEGSRLNALIIKHYHRWLRRDTHEFKSQGQVVASLLRQPDTSEVRKVFLKAKLTIPDTPAAVFGNSSDFDAVISILKGHTGAVLSVSCEGDLIASGSDDNTIIIWDAKTGDQVSILKGHTQAVKSVALHPGGSDQIASGSADGTIITWDAKTGEQISTLMGHTEDVRCVAWRPERPGESDQIASASVDKVVHVWDANEGVFRCVAWRPGGDQIASGSADKTIIIWDAKTGEQISALKGHTGSVTSVAWRPGGDQLASASDDKTTIVWDVTTGDRVALLKGHTQAVTSVAWRPGGDQIASASWDYKIVIWDAKTGVQVSTLKGHTSYVCSVAWSPGGDHIVSGGYGADSGYPWDPGEMIIWDATTGKQVSTLKGYSAAVMSVAWRPGGHEIASALHDKTIIIWDAKSGDVSTLKGHTSCVQSVVWHPWGDQIASGSLDNTVIIWNAKTGEQVSRLEGHTHLVTSVAWCPGGDQIVSGGGDEYCCGEVIIWDAKTGNKISELKGHTQGVNSVAWRPSGDQIVSGGFGTGETDDSWVRVITGEIIIWDTKSGDQVAALKGHTKGVMSVAWHPGGDQIASASCDETIIIWDAKTWEQVTTLKGHTSYVNSVAWRPGSDQIVAGCYGSGSSDIFSDNPGEIIIWDTKSGDQIALFKGHTKGVMSVAWRPGRDQIASASWDNTIIIWDAKTGDRISTLKGHAQEVMSIAWCPGGDHIASASYDKTIIIWDVKTGNQVSTLKGHTDAVESVAFRPGGDQVASGSGDKTINIGGSMASEGHVDWVRSVSCRPIGQQVASASGDNTLKVWDSDTDVLLSHLKGNSDIVLSVVWSTLGEQIISGSRDKTVIVWDSKTGEERLKLEGHTGTITSVACSVKGQVASGSSDGTVIIWDGQSGERKTTLVGHPGSVQGVAWSPSGDKIVTACSDELLFVWEAESGKQISTLQGQVGDVISVAKNLSAQQVTSDVQDGNSVCRWSGDKNVHGGVTEKGNQAGMTSAEVIICSGSTDQLTVASETPTLPIQAGLQIWTPTGLNSVASGIVWSANRFTSGCDDTIHRDIRDPFGHFAFDFDRIDRNGDGWLSADDLHYGLLSAGWEQDEVCELFDMMDTDGRITKDEFITCIALQSHRSVT